MWKLLLVYIALASCGLGLRAGQEEEEQGEHDRKSCRFGEEEGFWSAFVYDLYEEGCSLRRHAEALHHEAQGGPESSLKGSVLFIGDSLERNLVNWIGDQFNKTTRDLTPFNPYEVKTRSGRSRRVSSSLNRHVWVENVHFANLYTFGAGEPPYTGRAAMLATPELHNATVDRICADLPRYLPVAPDLVVVSSAYWDALKICQSDSYAWRRKHTPDSQRQTRPTRPRCANERQVDWEKFLEGYMQDVYRLLFTVQTCLPSARKIVWRTAPDVGVDERNPWWHIIPPYVTGYLNNAARYAATKNGFELLQMDLMAAGRASDMIWMPNGLYQGGDFNREYLNLILNMLAELPEASS